jgi:hypothetical protein
MDLGASMMYEQLSRMVREADTAELAVELLCMTGTLAHLEGEAYVRYVERHVLPHPARLAFYLEHPLERAVLRYVGLPVTAPTAPYLDLFARCLDHGAVAERMAVDVLPRLLQSLWCDPREVRAACGLLRRLAAHGDMARAMVADAALFRGLASHMTSRALVLEVTGVLDAFPDPLALEVFEPVVTRCAQLLAADYALAAEGASEQSVAALRLLERCAASHGAWRARLVEPLLALARPTWPLGFGPLLAAMLRTTSVELVLRLHARGKLEGLVRAAHIHVVGAGLHGRAWRDVRAALHRAWPGKVAAVLAAVGWAAEKEEEGERAKEAEGRGDGCCCPITLQPCVHPVVASDGHTYERDALLEHLARSGARSPVTREPLEYHLYANRAL